MASRPQTASTQVKPSKQKIGDQQVMQMARDAEEASRKQMEAKEVAFKKAEADRIQKVEQDKKDAEAKEVEDRKKSLEVKNGGDAKVEAEKAAEKKAAKEKRSKDKTFRKNHPAKLRVKLPPIDSYEKELEFIPDVPGRVVVRLERLMGTDRVRITDTKYLKTLLTQLEAEEQVIWSKRSKQRKLAERNRFRQLAIEGHMEPGPDMQDLFQHPVFRVNRILNRLSKLDTKINHSPTKKLPPITPVEPFEEYSRTGKLFDFHPGHYLRVQTVYKAEDDRPSRPVTAQPVESQEDVEFYKKLEAAKRANDESEAGIGSPVPGTALSPPRTEQYRTDEWGGEDYWEEEDFEEMLEDEEEEGEGGEEEEEGLTDACAVELLGRGSLTEAKQQYGISPSEDLLSAWMPYRSELIDKVYDDEAEGGGASEMYEFAKAVLGTYKREITKADNFVTKGLRKF